MNQNKFEFNSEKKIILKNLIPFFNEIWNYPFTVLDSQEKFNLWYQFIKKKEKNCFFLYWNGTKNLIRFFLKANLTQQRLDPIEKKHYIINI